MTAVSNMRVPDQIHFPLSFIWLISFLWLFGHPCSAGMTKHGAEITEAMLIWSNKLISAWNVGLPLLCSFAEKPFLVTLALGFPQRRPRREAYLVRNIIPREWQHCFCLGLVPGNPLLGGALSEGSSAVQLYICFDSFCGLCWASWYLI